MHALTSEKNPSHTGNRAPGQVHAWLCFAGVLTIMVGGVTSLDVELHILLIAAVMWVCGNAIALGFTFAELKEFMSNGIAAALSAIYIFILIGIVIAAFIESGTIAAIVYYSMDFISPAWFLPAALLFCSFMSVATGTSWGTVGTVGVVLVGLGSVIGVPLPVAAGAVVSGALFGDKMSPMSDTTILASACAETSVYDHIRSMSYTTGPAYLVALVLFGLVGTQFGAGDIPTDDVNQVKTVLAGLFSMHPVTFLPIVVVLLMSFRGVAAEPSMITASLVAIVIACLVQDRNIEPVLHSIQHGYSVSTGLDSVDTLLNRGGIQSMMWTLSLSLIALALGGLLDGTGFLRALTEGLVLKLKSTVQLVAATIGTGFLANMSMGENYLTIIFSSQVFKGAFRKSALKNRMLSRSVEEGATLTAGLIPWTTTGAFFAASLGVATTAYAPWVLLSFVNIVISLGMAALGIGVFYSEKSTAPRPGEN